MLGDGYDYYENSQDRAEFRKLMLEISSKNPRKGKNTINLGTYEETQKANNEADIFVEQIKEGLK